MENNYISLKKERHIEFLKFINENFKTWKEEDIQVVYFGESTQHIFHRDNYIMTIDWSKI